MGLGEKPASEQEAAALPLGLRQETEIQVAFCSQKSQVSRGDWLKQQKSELWLRWYTR